MKFYIDAEPLNLVVEADDMHHALQRVNDIDIGRSMMQSTDVRFAVHRISEKPSRKTEYREI